MLASALNWWLSKQNKPSMYTTRDGAITSWSVPGVPMPTETQSAQIIKDYLNSKDYTKVLFSYDLCMEELNRRFWNRMAVLAPIVGLIDLWMRWKNFTALKAKCLEWVADPSMQFEQQDFDLLNSVMKQQNIDLMQW